MSRGEAEAHGAALSAGHGAVAMAKEEAWARQMSFPDAFSPSGELLLSQLGKSKERKLGASFVDESTSKVAVSWKG